MSKEDKSILFHQEQIVRAKNSIDELAALAAIAKRLPAYQVDGLPSRDSWSAIYHELDELFLSVKVALQQIEKVR